MNKRICSYDGECPFKILQEKNVNCPQKKEGEETAICGMKGKGCPHRTQAGNFEPEETVWSIIK